MNKIPVKDWAFCLGYPYNGYICRINWFVFRKVLRCPDKSTGERPKSCPLPIQIEWEKK